jgi:hypothetical protein
MRSTADLYARTEAGLIVPRAAIPPKPEEIPTQELFVKLPKRNRQDLLRRGYEPRCTCGKRISSNAPYCATCMQSRAALSDRAHAAGILLPSDAK